MTILSSLFPIESVRSELPLRAGTGIANLCQMQNNKNNRKDTSLFPLLMNNHSNNKEKNNNKASTRSAASSSNKVAISKPGKTDILLGRGRGMFEWEGNQSFHSFVESWCDEYQQVHKEDRGRKVTEILTACLESGRRFLEKNPKDGLWCIATREKARRKVGQALRYRMRRGNNPTNAGSSSSSPANTLGRPLVTTNASASLATPPLFLRLVSAASTTTTNHSNNTSGSSSVSPAQELPMYISVPSGDERVVFDKDHQDSCSMSCDSSSEDQEEMSHDLFEPQPIFQPTHRASILLNREEQHEIDPSLFEGITNPVDLFQQEEQQHPGLQLSDSFEVRSALFDDEEDVREEKWVRPSLKMLPFGLLETV